MAASFSISPRIAHPHLPNPTLVRVVRRENAQRQPDVIVQIPLRLDHLELLSKNCRDQVFGRCLPVAAGNPDRRDTQMQTITPCQRLQCTQRVIDPDHRA